MTTRQRLAVVVKVTRDDGSDGTVQNMVWASSDETVLTTVMDDTGLTGFVNAVAAGGPARISCTGDADLGAGVIPIIGTSEDVDVTTDPRDQASAITITFGAAEDKP